jgi:hypothetical protein
MVWSGTVPEDSGSSYIVIGEGEEEMASHLMIVEFEKVTGHTVVMMGGKGGLHDADFTVVTEEDISFRIQSI